MLFKIFSLGGLTLVVGAEENVVRKPLFRDFLDSILFGSAGVPQPDSLSQVESEQWKSSDRKARDWNDRKAEHKEQWNQDNAWQNLPRKQQSYSA